MRILYISYFYPPLGGPAALRNQKTVRYLSEAGCTIDVLTVANIRYNYHDPDLLTMCKQNSIHRVPSFDPMAIFKWFSSKENTNKRDLYHQTPEKIKLLIRRFFPLDDKVLWLPALQRKGNQLLKADHHDCIYVSCGPFSSAVAAYRLACKFSVPLVLEMRDYWTLLKDYDLLGNALNRRSAHFWEKRLLQKASLVVTATRGIANDYAATYGNHLRDKTFVLYNGHDEADYTFLNATPSPTVTPPSDEEPFVISYFGALYARRSLKALLRALRLLTPRHRIKLKLYGNYHRETYREVEQSEVSHCVEFLPPLSHQAALQEMLRSDALLLVINSDSPKGTLTSKLFEYLRLQKPILALAPSGSEAAALLQESGHHPPVPMESTAQIASQLHTLVNERFHPPAFHYPAEKYERQSQVAKLHTRLSHLI